MKLIKIKTDREGCGGCIFAIEDRYCLLSLIEGYLQNNLPIQCTYETKSIFKLDKRV